LNEDSDELKLRRKVYAVTLFLSAAKVTDRWMESGCNGAGGAQIKQ
jgi:hypothetical protein